MNFPLAFSSIVLLSFLSSSLVLAEVMQYFSNSSLHANSKNAEDVLWWVQVSDIHISLYDPTRAWDLERHFSTALELISPSFILFTGDLTDAKSKDRRLTQQKIGEWKKYSDVVKTLSKISQIDEKYFIDLRGNHDTYEVPLRGATGDLFARFSLSGRRNNSAIHSILLQSKGSRFVFICIDIAPRIGIRGPNNFFGHPTDEDVNDLDKLLSEIQGKNDAQNALSNIIVFGHYPLSFIARSPSGKSIKDVLMKYPVDVYLSGHLHYHYWRKLYCFHNNVTHLLSLPFGAKASLANSGGFWEWTAGDWKENRMIRVLASDAGVTSFAEFKLVDRFGPPDASDFEYYREQCVSVNGSNAAPCNDSSRMNNMYARPIVLVTMPPDSRFAPSFVSYSKKLNLTHGNGDQGIPREIHVLVFSPIGIFSVSAVIYKSSEGIEQKKSFVEEVALAPDLKYKSRKNSPFFSGPLNSGMYAQAPSQQYWLEIVVKSDDGKVYHHPPQPFSVNSKASFLPQGWLEYTIVYTDWERIWPYTVALIYSFIFMLLLLPRVFADWLKFNCLYAKFSTWALRGEGNNKVIGSEFMTNSFSVYRSLAVASICRCILYSIGRYVSGSFRFIVWIYVDSSLHPVWFFKLAFALWTLFFPWLWGHALGYDHHYGRLSLQGWSFPSNEKIAVNISSSNLGVPDILTLVIPFLLLVVLPALLWLPLALSLIKFQCGSHSLLRICCGRVIRKVRYKKMCGSDDDVDVCKGKDKENVSSFARIDKEVMALRSIVNQYHLSFGFFVFICLSGCLIIYMYTKLCYGLSRAYGVLAVLLSPGFSWFPLYLVIPACFFQNPSL